jgi:hypothetical protein
MTRTPFWTRSRKVILAVATSSLWLGYMVIGLAVIDAVLPTIEGKGPHGAAAFIGLISGFFVTGFVMWSISD